MANARMTLGICVMDKKVPSMKPILDRLDSYKLFEIIHFGDKVILEDSVDCWPSCDCLIAFFSTGFPLEKAEEYAALRKPFLINELEPQHLLHDRRKVYEILQTVGVPVPKHAIVNRKSPFEEVDNFVEGEDFVEIDGERFWKPFVEKPVDGEDHHIMIYYPSTVGWGMKELFRKVGDKSSQFYPDVKKVRKDGSYIYEEFVMTGGNDVKVYTVGPDYVHGEVRKSPVVDGMVMRNDKGKEIRYPVLLTDKEKEIAKMIYMAFKQTVCGFDILRRGEDSYVCDVNGWSFVKDSDKYFDNAARVLRDTLLRVKAPHFLLRNLPDLPTEMGGQIQYSEGSTRPGSEKLRCVIAVLRHGDRTPKQKIKLHVTDKSILSLMLKYNGGRQKFQTKLKTAVQLKDLLDVLRIILQHVREPVDDCENLEKLKQVKAVLEEGGSFSGIYRKVQLKPSKWDGEGEEERPLEALMVLKFGGVLTHAGEKQAEELGKYFRDHMYPGEDTGLLCLHHTFRHDLTIYSSDEGRVQMSAAAFAKGLLDLEGQLTPILISLVSKNFSILDGLEDARIEIGEAKAKLNEMILSGSNDDSDIKASDTTDGAGLPSNAFELLNKLVQLTKEVTEQVRLLDITAGLPCGSEGFSLMYARWKKIERGLYNEPKKKFDITKIPDLYDSCKYDLMHNAHLKLQGLVELFIVAKSLADGVISNEYGINPKQKLKIGSKIAGRLLGKFLMDLRNTHEEAISDKSIVLGDKDGKETRYDLNPEYTNVRTECRVQTRLYFTSESHIHSLINVLRYCNVEESLQSEDGLFCHPDLERLYKIKELDYLSGIVLRMFENTEVPLEDPKRYRIEIAFSQGADLSLLEKNNMISDHTLPILSPERFQEVGSYLTLEKLEKMIRPFAKV